MRTAEPQWPVECRACSDGPILVLDPAVPVMPAHMETRAAAAIRGRQRLVTSTGATAPSAEVLSGRGLNGGPTR